MVQFCKTCLLQLFLCFLMFSSLMQEPCNMTYILRMLAKVGRSYRIYLAVRNKVWNFNSRLCMYICPVSATYFKLFVLCFSLTISYVYIMSFSHFQPHFQLFHPHYCLIPLLCSIQAFFLLRTFLYMSA